MQKPLSLLSCVPILLASLPGLALEPGTRLVTSGRQGVTVYDHRGNVQWSRRIRGLDDAHILPNGNVLCASSKVGVFEVTPDGKVVFEYLLKDMKGGAAMSCQRLPDGNTVIGNNSTGEILEVDPSGKVIAKLQTPAKPGSHNNLRDVKRLPNGNTMVCHKGGGLVEYKPDGSVAWKSKLKGTYYVAHLTDRDTIITSMLTKVVEIDRDSKVLWEVTKEDLSDGYLGKICGLSPLNNGNIVISFYVPFNKKTGKGAAVMEITREKKVVWQYPEDGMKSKDSAGSYLTVHTREENAQ